MNDTRLIGRDHPAAALRAHVDRTADSHGGLALVVGEAGIGKTALVTEAAARRRDDLLVAFATSWESEAVPDHWLWIQVLRSLRGRLGEDAWRSLDPAPAIGVLLGEGDGTRPVEFELHDAVAQLLVAASRRRPLMIVLDDLHYADPESIELLKFACQHTFFERILFVGTYRDSEVDHGHRLRARMLQLVSRASMISLDGLTETGVADLVRATVGAAPDPPTVAEITRRTGGNPFFVEQTAQLWASGQPVDATSAGMRDALRRRIDQLPGPLLRMLTLASVGGREFHAGVMAQASGIELHRIETALDAACETRLIRRERDRYAFVHDLVRETLYNAMDPAEAAHHHGCIVRALTADESLQKHMLVTEIAHHAWLAGDDLDPETAVRFIADAGAKSDSCMSLGGAEKYYRRALQRCTPAMTAQRVRLRIDLASTLQWGGRAPEARALYDRALLEAEDSGDPMLLVRAAVDAPQDQRVDELVRLKTLAYRALTGRDPEPGLDHEDLTRRLLYEHVLAARAGGSDEDLAFGLWAAFGVNWGPGTAARRQEIVEELAELTDRTGDTDMRLYAASLSWVVLLERGDPAYRSRLARFCALAENADAERWTGAAHVDSAIVDMVQGRFDAAAARIEAALAVSGENPMYAHMLRHLEWELALARGDLAERAAPTGLVAGQALQFDGRYVDLLTGLTALRRGETARARAVAARMDAEARAGFGSLESLWIRFSAELAAADGDAETVAALRRRLAPHAGEWLVAAWGTSMHGPVSHWLGVLAAAAGDTGEARGHFERAAAEADLLDARPWAEAARAALADLGRPAAPAPAPAAGDAFRRDGATWTLAYAGSTLHLPHAKGLADLHALLSRPGEEIAAADLLEPAEAVAADARLGGDDVLDAASRARFREHLETLDEQIDTAAAIGDDTRASALDAERQALIEHLKAATGLGGRARRLGDNHERARKSVTNRIRNTLKKIEDGHPALGEHLRETVATGSSCSYRPGPGAPAWRL